MDKIILVLPELEKSCFRCVKINECNINPLSDDSVPCAYETRYYLGFSRGIWRAEVYMEYCVKKAVSCQTNTPHQEIQYNFQHDALMENIPNSRYENKIISIVHSSGNGVKIISKSLWQQEFIIYFFYFLSKFLNLVIKY